MTIYNTLEDGSLQTSSITYIPVGSLIYNQAQQEVADGVSTIEPYVAPPPDPREVRDDALKALVHDFGDGRVIQVRPAQFASDEANIRNAIELMGRNSMSSVDWLMLDNTVASVTPAELQTALESGQDQAALIWATFTASQGV